MLDKQFSEEELDACVATYERLRPNYVRMCDSVASLLSNLIAQEQIPIHTIDGRAKEVDSFREKVTRDGKHYAEPLKEIMDLAGVRVVTHDKSARDRVCKLIEREFNVDLENSVDKGAQLKDNEFGYHSVHFVSQFVERRLALKEYEPFRDLVVEIQIRTVLQHAWSVIDQKLRYKRDADVPSELKRRLYRISGLLELADDEFSRILTDEKRLTERLRSRGRIRKAGLNTLSLSAFLDKSTFFRQVLIRFRGEGGDVVSDGSRRYLSSCNLLLRRLGIRTVADLIQAIMKLLPSLRDYFNQLQTEVYGERLTTEDTVVLEFVAVLYGCRVLTMQDMLDANWGEEVGQKLLSFAVEYRKKYFPDVE